MQPYCRYAKLYGSASAARRHYGTLDFPCSDHLVFAAFLAISVRLDGVNVAALAAAPFLPADDRTVILASFGFSSISPLRSHDVDGVADDIGRGVFDLWVP